MCWVHEQVLRIRRRRAMLDGALLTDEDTAAGPEAWAALDDPLPPWEEPDDEDAAGD